MLKKFVVIVLMLTLTMLSVTGCKKDDNKPAASEEPVTLTVAGSWTECRALDELAKLFTEKYPNCTIVYEYVQDYYASLETRLAGDNPVDLFFTTNIQAGNVLQPYALDIKSREDIDLSNTFSGLIENFMYREESGENTKLYSIPLGAEMRGLYVNKTLLNSLGIEVPTNQAELLAACQKLTDNGYIPMQGNPGDFGQILLYPWVCSLIANAEDYKAVYDKVNSREAGVTEVFREPCEFLYKLVENRYYDYKTAQTELNLYNDTTDIAYAKDFLNIATDADGNSSKIDDVGRVAFMPSPMSIMTVVEKVKEDYHSEIEYAFIPAPVGVDGGYVYLSPAHGIAAYKDSKNVDWVAKFLSFLYVPANNEVFAKAFSVIPNTKDAFTYIKNQYDIPENRMCELGQVTFDYDLYSIIANGLTQISKANNPKYMSDDGAGNLSLFPLQNYLDELEAAFAEK